MSDLSKTFMDEIIERYYPGGQLPPVKPLGNLAMLSKMPQPTLEPRPHDEDWMRRMTETAKRRFVDAPVYGSPSGDEIKLDMLRKLPRTNSADYAPMFRIGERLNRWLDGTANHDPGDEDGHAR
jgi:hypothetical protein